MRSELRKLTVLPTPRWTLFAVVLAAGIAAGVVAFTGPGDDSLALNLGVGLPTWIASLAIGQPLNRPCTLTNPGSTAASGAVKV